MTLKELNFIIHKESKSSTYKFALLRATIDIINNHSENIHFKNNRAYLPIGLFAIKWIEYFYPIFQNKKWIKAQTTAPKLAFETELLAATKYYNKVAGLNTLYDNLFKGIDNIEEKTLIQKLIRKLCSTIKLQPMRYFGSSIKNEGYSVYNLEPVSRTNRDNSITMSSILSANKTVSIPLEFFKLLEDLGTFLSGEQNILFQWSNFCATSGSNRRLDKLEILNVLLQSKAVNRNTNEAKKLVNQFGPARCVWDGSNITNFEIDHVFPYSIYFNNSLWNLLPSKSTTNNKKRAKIPTVERIENSKERIITYWGHYERNPKFMNEFSFDLNCNTFNEGIERMKKKSDYLINNKGYEPWK